LEIGDTADLEVCGTGRKTRPVMDPTADEF
jgi:hypothetical protein